MIIYMQIPNVIRFRNSDFNLNSNRQMIDTTKSDL